MMHQTLRKTAFAVLALSSCCAMIADGAAQSAYPDQPLRIMVGFAAGGSADLAARIAATALTERLGKPVIVENRGGAGGQLAAAAVARAEPNGYTLLFGSIALAVGTALDPAIQPAPLTELAPIALFAEAPNVLVINPRLPVKTVKELIAHAKAGNRLNFASSGIGTTLQLSGEMLKTATGADMVHIPYKGSGPALADLMAGQVQMMFDNLSTSLPLIRSNKLRALAVTTRSRSSFLPEVPTMIEAGFEGFEVSVWFGLFAPRNTPPPIVARLAREMGAIVADPNIPAKLRSLSMEAMKSESPEKFGEFFRRDVERWTKVVAAAGIKPEKN